MKVRVLSGNQKGQVLEMDRTEAEVNLSVGYVELVEEESVPVPVAVPVEPVELPAPKKSKRVFPLVTSTWPGKPSE